MNSPRVFALAWPGCGAVLQLNPSVDASASAYCDATIQVVRDGGAVSLRAMATAMQDVARTAIHCAAEFAVTRFPRSWDC